MAHRTARLNVFGRQLLVSRIELGGWPAAKAAEAQGVSRTTAHKWLRRYRAEGWAGLEDRRSPVIGELPVGQGSGQTDQGCQLTRDHLCDGQRNSRNKRRHRSG